MGNTAAVAMFAGCQLYSSMRPHLIYAILLTVLLLLTSANLFTFRTRCLEPERTVGTSPRTSLPTALPPPVKKPVVVCIMCIWEEQFTLPLALESSKDICTKYIVVEKIGLDNTTAVLKSCIQRWNLSVDYLQSDMRLRDARMWAYDKCKAYADYVIIQDGDEVFYTEGQTNINSFVSALGTRYKSIVSKMIYTRHRLDTVVLREDKEENRWGGHLMNGVVIIPHTTAFRNDPELVRWPPEGLDIPDYGDSDSWLVSHKPWKWDCSVKTPLRMYLRNHFYKWDLEYAKLNISIMEYMLRYDQEYAKVKDSVSLNEYVERWAEHDRQWGVKYNPGTYYDYPSVIKKYLDRGFARGFEGTFV